MNLACIISGDRNATPERWREVIRGEIDRLLTYVDGGDLIVIHGMARGIDTIADTIAVEMGIAREAHGADWTQHGKAAGPIRNQAMLDRLLRLQRNGYRVGVLAFHDDLEHSKGTGGMVRIARAASVPVLTFTSAPTRGPKEGREG